MKSPEAPRPPAVPILREIINSPEGNSIPGILFSLAKNGYRIAILSADKKSRPIEIDVDVEGDFFGDKRTKTTDMNGIEKVVTKLSGVKMGDQVIDRKDKRFVKLNQEIGALVPLIELVVESVMSVKDPFEFSYIDRGERIVADVKRRREVRFDLRGANGNVIVELAGDNSRSSVLEFCGGTVVLDERTPVQDLTPIQVESFTELQKGFARLYR